MTAATPSSKASHARRFHTVANGPTVIDDILLQQEQGKQPKHVKMTPQEGANKGRRGSNISVESTDYFYDGYDYIDTLQRTPPGRGLYIHDNFTIRKKPFVKRLAAVLTLQHLAPPVGHGSQSSNGTETTSYQEYITRSGNTLVRQSDRAVLPREAAQAVDLLAAQGNDGVANRTESYNPRVRLEGYSCDVTQNIPATRKVIRMHARTASPKAK